MDQDLAIYLFKKILLQEILMKNILGAFVFGLLCLQNEKCETRWKKISAVVAPLNIKNCLRVWHFVV